MKKQSQDQTNEQLHIDDAAAAQEEYSLEDIMNEFGGWSKKLEPEKQVQTPPDPQKPPEKTPESRKPEAKVVRFPKGQPIRAEGEPKEPKNPADFKGQTIRFTPIREDAAPEEKPKIWTYQAEPDPEPVSDDPKEAKKAAQRARRAEKEAKKRQKQLERHQKQQAKRMGAPQRAARAGISRLPRGLYLLRAGDVPAAAAVFEHPGSRSCPERSCILRATASEATILPRTRTYFRRSYSL